MGEGLAPISCMWIRHHKQGSEIQEYWLGARSDGLIIVIRAVAKCRRAEC